MTSSSSEILNDIPVFFNVAFIKSGEGNCTFVPETISDQSEDIVDWFEKNDEESSSSNMICNKPDPLLNQVNAMDSPILLHLSDSDADQLGDICMNILDNPESDYFERKSFHIDRNMNSLAKESDSSRGVKLNKCDTLENLIRMGITVEVNNHNNKFQVKLQDENDMDVFPTYYIQTKEAGHTREIIIKQLVNSLTRTKVSPELETQMPCLNAELGLRLWLCPHLDCKRAFYRFNLAKLHALRHLEHKPFKCDYPNCKWAFYTAFKMKRHQETHSKRKDFICTHSNCNRRFTTIYNLNWHRRQHHEKPATIPCSVNGCDKYFQTVHAREVHLKVHGKIEAPYQCPVDECKKQFFLYTALSTHARVHSHKPSDLRCQWPNCGRIFEQPCRLKQHTLQHTGQRPFICTYDECKWAFSTASKLKRHLSTHTNERKFHCTMGSCNKSFLRSEHLREHTLTHIGQRPFNCDDCDATFSGKSALYLHIKKSHFKIDKACARAIPYKAQNEETPSSEDLLEQAIQSLDVPSDLMLGTGLLPEEPLELLENDNFSTVNLRDLD